ncbi:septum formation family protein [Corynebacterium breve]|uniref:Septum formation family protein n=1 Tax=Corynebacterium breve TaxID=3049799 RepID=A0ABY8VCZ0_9CORY|nr:septum formation family protein [Corynebacterium breve]WIM67524.1 septum formation family protein [Corynebacterium breve]
MSSTSTWRSPAGVRALLIAALAGTVAVGSFYYFSDEPGDSTTQASQITDPAADSDTTSAEPIAPFTTADKGSCLTWDIDDDGEVSNFEQTSCDTEHRFEVSVREDLGTYPTSEFGRDADMPTQTRQAQLREELCHTPTIRYLDGRYDSVGKYSIAPILPPAAAWEQGDRTMLCGLQVTDSTGTPQLNEGRAVEQDQANYAEPGECVVADSSNVVQTVDCGEDHAIEVTRVENLAPVFPDSTPSIEDQDEHLKDVCTDAAIEFLGGEENLYQSTLQPYWGTLPAERWEGGSRTVNCGLVHANNDGGFSSLKGSATAGRDGFTIDGEKPAEQPERDPIREN